jgi:hypothetical protein
MRRPVDADQIRRFMRDAGREADTEARLYFTGGATAVLVGWRSSTVDVDIKIDPESDRLMRCLPELKERLQINIELASPDQFIPEVPGWAERSVFIEKDGRLSYYHYDLYSQALAKLERSHSKDLIDVREMLSLGLIERNDLLRRFEQIEAQLYRYPAIDPKAFRRAVEEAVRE